MYTDIQGPLFCMSLNRIKLTSCRRAWHWRKIKQHWPWNVTLDQGSLNWLFEILVDGNESCVGAYHSTLKAYFQHVFLIICWSLPVAHVLGLEKGLGSKAVDGEAEREQFLWHRGKPVCQLGASVVRDSPGGKIRWGERKSEWLKKEKWFQGNNRAQN